MVSLLADLRVVPVWRKELQNLLEVFSFRKSHSTVRSAICYLAKGKGIRSSFLIDLFFYHLPF